MQLSFLKTLGRLVININGVPRLKIKVPQLYIDIEKLLYEFMEGESTDVSGLLKRIKEKFKESKSSYMDAPPDVFHVLDKLEINNPTSLMEAVDKLKYFVDAKPIDTIPSILSNLFIRHKKIEASYFVNANELKTVEAYISALQDFLFKKIDGPELLSRIDQIYVSFNAKQFNFYGNSEVGAELLKIQQILHQLIILTKNFSHNP